MKEKATDEDDLKFIINSLRYNSIFSDMDKD